MKKIFNKIFYFLFFIFVNGAIFLDSYKYPGFFEKHFFIDSKILFLFFIFYLIIFFIKNKSFFKNKIFRNFNLIFFILSFVLMSVFSFLEFSHHDNYVYSLFHINHAHFILFFIEGVLLILLNFLNWFLKKINVLIIFIFIVFLLIGLFAYTFQMNLFIEMNKEDQLVETIQFFVVLFASGAAFFLASFYKKRQQKWLVVFYILFGIALLLVAADEISWGQRILNYQTPEAILDYADQQQEVSLHNNKYLAQHLGQIYLAVGIYGSFSFLLYDFLKRNNHSLATIIKHFIILMPASLFFMLKLLYDYLDSFSGIEVAFKFHSWSEYTELAMYLAIIIHLFLIYYREIKKKATYGKN